MHRAPWSWDEQVLRPALALAFALLFVGAGGCSRQSPLAPRGVQPSLVAPQALSQSNAEDEVLVTLGRGNDAAAFAADYGATVVREEDWGCATLRPQPGETPGALALRLAGDARVVTSETNGYLESPESRQQSFAFDDGFGSQQTWLEQDATTAIRLHQAHQVARGGGVRVAILDTGAELNHPALAGRVVGGWDFVGGDADPSDVGDLVDNDLDGLVDEALGHGTHVAGIVALTAPAVQLLIVRVLDADGRGDMMQVAAGIRWAADHGARVINLSLGALRSSDAVQYALEQVEARGVVCVTSAGNWGAEQPEEYPARSSHAVAVAALDANDQPASFTSFGGFVALSAPGVGIRSSYRNGSYVLWSGTSMSAPFVSGVAALLIGIHPGWNQDKVLERLGSTARPLGGSGLGAGALDAGAALAPDLLPPPTGEEDPRFVTDVRARRARSGR